VSDAAHHVTHHDAVRCALAGIAAVDPVVLVERALTGHSYGPNVSLVAIGKAAPAMAAAVADMLGPYLRRGIVIAPTPVSLPGAPIVAYCGGHPIPTAEGYDLLASLPPGTTRLGTTGRVSPFVLQLLRRRHDHRGLEPTRRQVLVERRQAFVITA